jgi:hypothetical protein
MPDFVATKVGNFSWAVSLMPIRRDKNPSALADFWEESLIGCPCVRRDVLTIDTIPDAASVKLVDDFGAVPVLVKVES